MNFILTPKYKIEPSIGPCYSGLFFPGAPNAAFLKTPNPAGSKRHSPVKQRKAVNIDAGMFLREAWKASGQKGLHFGSWKLALKFGNVTNIDEYKNKIQEKHTVSYHESYLLTQPTETEI